MDSRQILEQANEINGCYLQAKRHPRFTRELFINIVSKQYPDLKDKYESIFNMACSDKYNSDMLKYMLAQADKVKSGQIDQNTADVNVGTILVNGIVKPQLDKAGVKPNSANQK